LRDVSDELNISKWRKNLYHRLAMGFTGTDEQEKRLNMAMDIMAAIIIPTSIVAYSLLAWLFGMNLRPGWNSSIFAPQFVLTAAYSGVALVIVIIWIYYQVYKLHKKYITKNHFYFLGYGLLILSLLFGYFLFSDFITNWYNTQKTTALLFQKMLDPGQYGIPFVASIIVTMFLPMIVIGVPKLRTINNIALVSFLVLLGLWINRYLLMVPVLETPYIPVSDPRPEYFSYDPTWVEWSLTITGISFSLLLFMILSKLAPIIPLSELKERKSFKVFGKFTF
ncbi:MAG: NrfD/PsrC family molybdoenzyme membrane anchor subunit, partial [Draconibacterium sp.]|nr:NrfD/PsrC family molybdoenzyme membrane anchor subunit [Draconibacterium sp.]